jgi:hypothetical protein
MENKIPSRVETKPTNIEARVDTDSKTFSMSKAVLNVQLINNEKMAHESNTPKKYG